MKCIKWRRLEIWKLEPGMAGPSFGPQKISLREVFKQWTSHMAAKDVAILTKIHVVFDPYFDNTPGFCV